MLRITVFGHITVKGKDKGGSRFKPLTLTRSGTKRPAIEELCKLTDILYIVQYILIEQSFKFFQLYTVTKILYNHRVLMTQ